MLILLPVFNDWIALQRLLAQLHVVLEQTGQTAQLLIVDDASTERLEHDLVDAYTTRFVEIEVLHLRRNLGAQRAIAIGLSYIDAHRQCESVVIMDGDGEDRPEDVPRLVAEYERAGRGSVVFAERTRRSEGLGFVVMYAAYRALHLVLTGERVRVGNFSIVPMSLVHRLVAVSDLWNHYAAAVFKARIPYQAVSTTRGTRYHGRSHLNYVALITHGLSAMSVFGDRIGVRMLAATTGVALATTVGIAAALGIRLNSGAPLPPWAPYGLMVAALALFQAFVACLTFAFIILGARDTSTFIPLRDYSYFIGSVRRLRPAS